MTDRWSSGPNAIKFVNKCLNISIIITNFSQKLIVLNVLNGKQHIIPSLKSSSKAIEPENPCGIHAIEINPSGTLLATGGHNPNDVAVYRLPTLDPVCVGEVSERQLLFIIKLFFMLT